VQAQDVSNTDKKEEPRNIKVNNDTRQMSEIPTENSALSATSNHEVGDGSELLYFCQMQSPILHLKV